MPLKLKCSNFFSFLNHPSVCFAAIHPLFQRGLAALLALFEKEGGSIASAIETGDLYMPQTKNNII
jgi:hypothetical protein